LRRSGCGPRRVTRRRAPRTTGSSAG
jgi:hypothetical protein